ncbi:MAG: hypothetical protein Kow0010_02720 [Dehalococcoidia bacterium]
MSDDRITRLFDDARRTGEVPPGASPEERAEVEAMLRIARLLDESAGRVSEEAQASMPLARARFERFLAAQQAAKGQTPVQHERRGLFGWFGRHPRMAALASSALGLALLLVVAVAGGRPFFSDTQSAYASELDPGDYVQIEGVVTRVQDGEAPRLAVQSQFGTIEVELDEVTSLVDEDDRSADLSAVAPGRRVIVSGLVDRHHRVRAATLALSAAGVQPPPRMDFERPRDLPSGVQATILWFSQSEDGREGKLAVETADGRRLVVRVDAESIAGLLHRHPAGPGVVVELFRPAGAPEGVFAIRFSSPPPEPDAGLHCGRQAGRLHLVNVCGVVVERDDARLRVQTREGVIDVGLRRDTRFVLGPGSGLTIRDLRDPQAGVGHFVAIAGGPARGDGTIMADIVIVGSEAPALD